MTTPTVFARRLLQAKPEVQGTLIATANTLNVLQITNLDGVELGAINLALVAWMGLTAKVAYGQGLEALATGTETVANGTPK